MVGRERGTISIRGAISRRVLTMYMRHGHVAAVWHGLPVVGRRRGESGLRILSPETLLWLLKHSRLRWRGSRVAKRLTRWDTRVITVRGLARIAVRAWHWALWLPSDRIFMRKTPIGTEHRTSSCCVHGALLAAQPARATSSWLRWVRVVVACRRLTAHDVLGLLAQ